MKIIKTEVRVNSKKLGVRMTISTPLNIKVFCPYYHYNCADAINTEYYSTEKIYDEIDKLWESINTDFWICLFEWDDTSIYERWDSREYSLLENVIIYGLLKDANMNSKINYRFDMAGHIHSFLYAGREHKNYNDVKNFINHTLNEYI